MTATGSMKAVRGSRATCCTTSVTGGTTKWHDYGDGGHDDGKGQ
jgi:hypothetical protein